MKTVYFRAMKAITLMFLLSGTSIICSTTLANSNFVSNPYLPYPPSCVRMPGSNATALADTGAVMFFEEEMFLPDQQTYEQVEFVLRAYRSPCSEPGRSLLWLEFSLAEPDAGKNVQVMLPVMVADFNTENNISSKFLVPVSEPNSWGAGSAIDRERIMLVSQPHGDYSTYNGDAMFRNSERSWWFLLDNESPLIDYGYNVQYMMSAAEYNSHFSLRLRYPPDYPIMQFEVPSTAEMGMVTNENFPLTGRLSGNWIIDGANDQGFMLAISSRVAKPDWDYAAYPPLVMVIFFSQYTFDQAGKMLWLTGSAEFLPGTRQVSFPIVEVSNGEFRSDQPAQRRTVGQITLTANNCNDITMQYDYDSLGLGSGTKRLQRLISLETAGYDCRDYAARVEANQ